MRLSLLLHTTFLLLVIGSTVVQAEDSTVASASIPWQFVSIAAVPAPVRVNSRTIVTFRASVLNATPVFRATATVQRIDALLDEAQNDSVEIEWEDSGAILVVGQRQAVLITTQDVDPDLDGDFRTVALKARSVLQTIVSEERERRPLPHLLRAIGASSGTATQIGFFSTRLRTACQEEVAIPNTTVVRSTVVNHTRLGDGGIAYSTSVTIGCDTPWRLVHEMLIEAARRVRTRAQEPAPYVTQTALQDFYIEYRRTVVIAVPGTRRETVSDLHGAIQDVFNENGVQIMSPHYVGDPGQEKIVDPTQANSPMRRPQ